METAIHLNTLTAIQIVSNLIGDHLSNYKKDEFKLLLLDNGAFNHSKKLKVPKNISLLFIPPYSPELNPAESIWRQKKDLYRKSCLPDIIRFIKKVSSIIKNLDTNIVQSITDWKI